MRDDNKLVPFEAEQKVIEEIHSMKKQGNSLRAIASMLNEKGIPAKRGGIWYASAIRCILHNEVHDIGNKDF